MRARLPWILLLALAALAPAIAAPGCGLQGEGEPCNRDDGDEDCGQNLVCKPQTELGRGTDVCCPRTGVSDNVACIPQSGQGSSSSASTGTGGSGSGSGTGGAGTGGSGTGGAGTGGGGTGGAGTGGKGGGGGS